MGTKTQQWVRGPWTDEKDETSFSHKGYMCTIMRRRIDGALEGYVAIVKGHPLYATRKDNMDLGISYAGFMAQAEPGADKLWTVGITFSGSASVSPWEVHTALPSTREELLKSRPYTTFDVAVQLTKGLVDRIVDKSASAIKAAEEKAKREAAEAYRIAEEARIKAEAGKPKPRFGKKRLS